MSLSILAVAGASRLLILDSAVKATVLLGLAAVAAALLRRDSAATRHLVWMLAIVAILFVPVLSATLPAWRVLPAWADEPTVVDRALPPRAGPVDAAIRVPPNASRPITADQPAAG